MSVTIFTVAVGTVETVFIRCMYYPNGVYSETEINLTKIKINYNLPFP